MTKNIKTIYLSNILEGYYKSYNTLKSKIERNFWIQYDTLDGNRAIFYGGDDKVLITSLPINKAHFKNTKDLMGWNNVHNLSPIKNTPSISDDCIKDKKLQKEIIKIISNNPGISIIPYRLTPQFQKFIHFLKSKSLIFKTPETIPEEKQFILNYFNTKRGFRHLWHLSNASNPPFVQIPEGFITQNKREAIDAAWWFKQRETSFVIKYNSGVQGLGIELIDQTTLPREKRKFYALLKNRLKDKIWSEPIIIVEQAIIANENAQSISPSLDVYIDPQGKVTAAYASDQIFANDKRTFRGIYIYPKLMTDPAIKKACKAGVIFGKKLAEYGYRGVLDIDLIRSTNNKIYAVEANLRRNGGTHLHELCLSLLGKNYGNSYHTLIEDIILIKNHKLTYNKCLSLFASNLYSHKTHSGIIFINPDVLKVNICVIALIAKSKKQIRKLREDVDIALNGEVKEVLVARDWGE